MQGRAIPQEQHVIIVGGGISGLATAYYLQQQAHKTGQSLTIHLVEATPRWGGVIRTVREGGFIVEGGPDSILSYKPAGLALWRELGLMEEVVGTSREHQGSFIYSRGALHPLPEGLTLMIPARLGPLFRTSLISWKGKVRAGLDLLRTHRPDGRDVSVAEFVCTHLGQEVFERIVEPLFAGIYGGDARELSVAATYPQLLDITRAHGSLLRGLLAHRRQARARRNGSPRWTPFVTLRQGLYQMVETLLSACSSVHFHPDTPVKAVRLREGSCSPSAPRWEVVLATGERHPAHVVVLATPAHISAQLVASFDGELAHSLAAIPYASTVTVSLAYPREAIEHPLNGYGFVVPRVEGRPLLACTWTSSKFPHRAPQGHVLLRCFLGRAGADEVLSLSDAEIVALVRQELRDIMGIKARPERVWIFRWSRALPQYVIGHRERLEHINARVAHWPGLYLVGNAYRGVGIPDCIAGGQHVAQQVLSEVSPTMEGAQ